uniref:DUF4219 domain-containing protein n=1 Tax=Brassica oleracea var. oleracea TaxID=109376 RepID=A0A0D3D3E6_BRAOL
MSSACKNIIAELNRGEKQDGDNYDIWYRKIHYVLEEQEVKETVSHLMEDHVQGTTSQHERVKEAYTAWKTKNNIARITMISFMNDDLMCEFEEYNTAKGVWEALKEKFCATAATKLRRLNQNFNDYKKLPNHSMRQHLRVMSNMIRELKNAGQTFEDISRHFELEDERLKAARPFNEANFAKSNWDLKRKRGNKGNKAPNQADPKSCTMLTESHPLWIVDSGATDHVARSREAFVEYRRITTRNIGINSTR